MRVLGEYIVLAFNAASSNTFDVGEQIHVWIERLDPRIALVAEILQNEQASSDDSTPTTGVTWEARAFTRESNDPGQRPRPGDPVAMRNRQFHPQTIFSGRAVPDAWQFGPGLAIPGVRLSLNAPTSGIKPLADATYSMLVRLWVAKGVVMDDACFEEIVSRLSVTNQTMYCDED